MTHLECVVVAESLEDLPSASVSLFSHYFSCAETLNQPQTSVSDILGMTHDNQPSDHANPTDSTFKSASHEFPTFMEMQYSITGVPY